MVPTMARFICFFEVLLKMVRILMPSGESNTVSSSQTVDEAIRHCVVGDHSTAANDYSLVFLGRKLSANQLLADVPHLTDDESRSVRLVCRKKTGPGAEISRAEVDKLRSQCRTMYQNLGEELQHNLDTYMTDQNCAMFNSILKDHLELVHDSVAISIVRDLRLLVPAILENNEFAYEHPICAKILKKTLLQFGIMQQRPDSSSFMAPHGVGPFVFPGQQQRVHQPVHGRVRGTTTADEGTAATVLSNQQPVTGPPSSLITHDMLSEAMNVALGGASAGPSSTATVRQQQQPAPMPTTTPPPSSVLQTADAAPQYAVQLGLLHEYGFANDVENVQVLMMADGDVEQALQILIAMREDN